jgi:hypothetical protein
MMTHDFDRLAKDLKKLTSTVKKNMAETVIKTAVMAGSSVIIGTPVDTGKARGNWQTSIDSPILSAIDRNDPAGNEAIKELGTVSQRFTVLNKIINLTNNLPYINRLNTGWSKKAAPGYIERAISATVAQVKEDALLKG